MLFNCRANRIMTSKNNKNKQSPINVQAPNSLHIESLAARLQKRLREIQKMMKHLNYLKTLIESDCKKSRDVIVWQWAPTSGFLYVEGMHSMGASFCCLFFFSSADAVCCIEGEIAAIWLANFFLLQPFVSLYYFSMVTWNLDCWSLSSHSIEKVKKWLSNTCLTARRHHMWRTYRKLWLDSITDCPCATICHFSSSYLVYLNTESLEMVPFSLSHWAGISAVSQDFLSMISSEFLEIHFQEGLHSLH